MTKGSKFQDHLKTELLDPEFAANYLASALEEGDDEFLSDALADVVRVHGATKISSETGIARQAIYKMLSSEGNPSFKNISKLLDSLGLEVTIQTKNKVS